MNTLQQHSFAAAMALAVLSGCSATQGWPTMRQPVVVYQTPAQPRIVAPIVAPPRIVAAPERIAPTPPPAQPKVVYVTPPPQAQTAAPAYAPRRAAPTIQTYDNPAPLPQAAPPARDGAPMPRLNPRYAAQTAAVAQRPALVRQAPAQSAPAQPVAAPRAQSIATRDLVYSSIADPNAPVPPGIDYNIPHLPQEEPLWCWAAAAQQAIGWVNRGRAPTQCAVVALAHGIDVDACCSDKEGICAKTGEIPQIAKLIKHFGGDAVEISVPRDPKLIYNLLQQGKTLLIRLRPDRGEDAIGIRHMIVVRGMEWLRFPNGRLVATLLYNDPLGDDQRAVTFDEIEPFFEQALMVERR